MLQGALFPPEAKWSAPRLIDLPSNWNMTSRLGIDTETCDPYLKKLGPSVRRGGFIAGISFAVGENQAYYLPLRHLGGDNMENPDKALEYVREQAANFEGEVVGARLDYDLDYLAEAGITFPKAKAFKDVQVAEPLLDELQFSYSLDNILKRHGLPLKFEDELRKAAIEFKVDPKADLWKLPARYVGQYAEADALRPLELLRKQEEQMEKLDLMRIWQLETAVTPVLVKMRRRGVKVDFDHLDKVERFSTAEEMKAWGELQRLTGVAVRVGDAMKAEVIAHALMAVGIHTPFTSGGKGKPKPSITKDWLEALDHPAGAIIRRARKMSQLRTTFVASIRTHAIKDRIHCTFNQIVRQEDDSKETEGAAYGRLSAQDPNLQQQPARDPEIGPFWRKSYVPDDGAIWGSLDYSQQEPRLAVHFAVASGAARLGHKAFLSATTAAQRYWDDRTTDAHTMFTQLVHGDDVMEKLGKDGFKQARTILKNIYLGICYGMGEPKMCRQLGLPTKILTDERSGRKYEVAGDEGRRILDMIDRNVPYVKATAKAVEKVAKERGYIVTIGGRRCNFAKDQFGNFDWTHKAFNRAIQGSAADQTKTAMVELDRAGFPIQLQVHDEFDWSLGSVEEGRRAAEIMENCVQLRVPSKVDLEVGPSWGEIKDAA